MSDNEPTHRIGVEKDVFKAITEGRAKMRPKSYFAAQAALVIIAVALALFLVIIIATFISFALQEDGGLYAAGFGVSGFEAFAWSVPWTVVLLFMALLLAIGIFLRRRYAFAYQWSFFSLILALVAVTALASALIPAVPFDSGIYHFAKNGGVPWLPGIFQYETRPANGLYRGEVISFGPSSTESFVLEGALGNTSTVIIAPAAASELQGVGVGEYVLVYGRPVATNTISASGVESAWAL